MHSFRTPFFCAIVFSFSLHGPPLHASDWPEFRGVGRMGLWMEENVVEKFSSAELKSKWSAPIGPGYSGPTVKEGRVFVMDRTENEERVVCLDRETGEQLWVHAYPCDYKEVGFPLGPRSSVTVAGDLAWAMGTMGHLHCLDAATGEVLWSKDGGKEYSINMPLWGIAASPLVEGSHVIVQLGGADGACIVAFDKRTGEEAWRAFDDRASYVSPVMIEQGGTRVLVVWTAERIAGMDAATGKVHWEHLTPPDRWPINVSGPALDDTGERMFLTTIGEGSRLLRLHKDELKVEEVWARRGVSERKTDALQSMISPPFIRGDFIYGVDSYGQLRCLKVSNGDRVWESVDKAMPEGIWATLFMVQNGNRTWMFTEEGHLIIAELTSQGYREISRTKIIEPTTFLRRRNTNVVWSQPAFAGTQIFARNDKELVCVEVGSLAPDSRDD